MALRQGWVGATEREEGSWVLLITLGLAARFRDMWGQRTSQKRCPRSRHHRTWDFSARDLSNRVVLSVGVGKQKGKWKRQARIWPISYGWLQSAIQWQGPLVCQLHSEMRKLGLSHHWAFEWLVNCSHWKHHAGNFWLFHSWVFLFPALLTEL